MVTTRGRKAATKAAQKAPVRRVSSESNDSLLSASDGEDDFNLQADDEHSDEEDDLEMDDDDLAMAKKGRAARATTRATTSRKAKKSVAKKKPTPATRSKQPANKSTATAKPKTAPQESKKEALRKCDSFNTSDGDDDDNGDDSDDSSDIGKRLTKVKFQASKFAASSEDEISDKSSSDDDDSDVQVASPGKRPATKSRFAQRLAMKKKKTRLQRDAKRAAGANDSDDSGSEIEIIIPYQAQRQAKARDSLDGLSSDDEKEVVTVNKTKKVSEFSKAMQDLQSAQAYHAEDVDVPEGMEVENNNSSIDDDEVICLEGAPPQSAKSNADGNATTTAKKDLGAPITVKLRTNNGGKVSEQLFKIRMLEPMSVLMDKYKNKNNITPAQAANLSFHFDGEKLNDNATPASFDMEDDELIDVVMKA